VVYHVSMLGPLQVTDGAGRVVGIEGYKSRCLFVILVLARGSAVPFDRLIDELWDGAPPPCAEKSLHAHVCRLRRAFAGNEVARSLIVTRRQGYELAADGFDVDIDRFAQLADQTRADLGDGRVAEARACAQRALELWRGPALADFRDRGFAALEASRVEERRIAVIEDGVDAALGVGQHGSLVGELEQLVVEHPFRERLYAQLMLALYRSGRQADALRVYRRAYRILRDELGVLPGPALRDLEAAILRHDAELIAEPGNGDLVDAARHAACHAARLWVRAGDEAMACAGFRDAVTRYETAVTTLGDTSVVDPDLRSRAVLALGDARHADYDRQGARTAYLDAARRAVVAGHHEPLARAAWGLTAVTEFAGVDPEAEEVLTEALHQLGPVGPGLRARLLAAIARTAPPADPDARARVSEAIEIARGLGDPATLAVTVSTWCLVCWGPDDLVERERHIVETIELAELLGWVELAMEARNWLSATRWEHGDDRGAARELADVVEWQRTANRPFFRCLTLLRQASELLGRGDYGAAAVLLDDPPSALATSPDFLAGFASQQFTLRRDQGRLAELSGLIDGHRSDPAAVPAWSAAAAATALALDRGDEARAIVHQVLNGPGGGLPRDWVWLAAMTLLADVAVALEDRPAARVLLPLLRPYADRRVVLAHGILTMGSAARTVAELAALVGDRAEADLLFQWAIAVNSASSAHPWLARTQLGYARLLQRFGQESAAAELRGRAHQLIDRLGAAGLC
jgi:DNA-binding SARP family transcriptional activator